jgi:hypothetical protein
LASAVLSEEPTAIAVNRIAAREIAATFVDGVLRCAGPGVDPFAS